MAFNSFGNILRLTSFGESHGVAIGGVIDGFHAGVELDLDAVQKELDRRKPGQSKIVTQRKEPDTVEFLSGIFEGKSTGTSIGFVIKNTNGITWRLKLVKFGKNLINALNLLCRELIFLRKTVGTNQERKT